jgi:hypothetical protein
MPHSINSPFSFDPIRTLRIRLSGLFALLLLTNGVARAVTVSYTLTDISAPDTNYNDGDSSVISSPGGNVVIRGVGYSDDASGVDRWGILNGMNSWNGGRNAAIIRNGFAPSSVGNTTSLQSGLTVAASYISVKVNRPANTVFTNVSLELTGKGLVYPNVWAGAAGSVAPGFRDKGKEKGTTKIAFNFANLNDSGSAPLELRVYGFVGADMGQLTSTSITYTFVPMAVPEPGAASVVFLAGVAILIRRRRG